ncbi:MAG: TolC family outer membrane protein, partial [Asticcacaulis sp.]
MQGARHNRLKFKWQGALSLLVLMSAMAVSPAHAESLADAIAQAYAQNPTLQRARALQRANDETYVQARSGLGPSLSFGADIGYQDPGMRDVASQETIRSTTGLSLNASQPLFSSGGLTSGLNAAEADVRAGQEDLRTIESQVLLQVIDVYTAVRRDQEALRIQQESYGVLNQQLEETRARFEVGELTRTDVAQSEARLAAASAAVSAAQAKLDASRAAYVAIVGQSPVALDPAPALQVPNDFTQALNRAENNNPSLRAAQYSEAAARSRVSQARSGLGPNVGLTASYGINAPTNDFRDLGSRDVATAGIRVTVPLFTSGLNSSRVRQASENYNAQRIS